MVARRSESGARRQSRAGPITARRPRSARSSSVRSRAVRGAGTSATASVARAIVSAREPSWKRTPEASSRGIVTATRAARQHPAGGRGGLLGGDVVGGAVQQQLEQLDPPAVHLAGPLGLLEGEPLRARRGQLLDVGEDRLAEGHQRLGVQPGLERVARHPAQRDPGTRPVCGEQPSRVRPCRTSPRPRAAYTRRLSGVSAGSVVPGSSRNRPSATSTPCRTPSPNRPSRGRA